MDAHSDSDNRLIVVLDGCEEITGFEPGTDKLLRSVMERHANINYVFIGSDEGAAALFEDDRAAFFHFGVLMRLSKIPHDAFIRFLVEKLKPIRGDKARDDAAEILEFAKGHALFVQQLAAVSGNAAVWKASAPPFKEQGRRSFGACLRVVRCFGRGSTGRTAGF